MTAELGRRYKCNICGTEVLCTKEGAGTLNCCGKEMELYRGRVLINTVDYEALCDRNKKVYKNKGGKNKKK